MKDKTFEIRRSQILQLNHILRNKLNSVLGFIELICEEDELTVKEKEQYLKIIKTIGDDIYTNIDCYDLLSLDYDKEID